MIYLFTKLYLITILLTQRVPCYEPVTCPICLDYPVAGKITRCGHIYCWPCILRYLSLTDKPWMKCPICFEAVHRENLKR